MDKILEALGSLLPEDQVKQISAAVNEMLAAEKTNLKNEFTAKLDAGYAELATELKEAEATAEAGYKEAYAIIEDLHARLETQRNEYETAMDEGYEEAYQMILAERGKNEKLELEMYESYDKKLAEMKDYMVEKIDAFLQGKTVEMYEHARRDILNDPAMVEHKLTLDRVVETVAEYISDEDYALATSKKLEDLQKQLEDFKANQKILEARNIRLSMDNKNLNESVKKKEAMIVEHKEEVKVEEKKERAEKVKNVTGRGVVSEGIVPEFSSAEKKDNVTKTNRLVEQIGPAELAEMRALSGRLSK
jgi:regulator of replication initiation timing